MALGLQKVTGPIQKNLPRASNMIGAGVVGIGAYRIARFLDGMIGGRIQAIGIGLPILGSISVLDVLMLTAFKATMRKKSLVVAAFAGDRIFNLAQNPAGLIPSISLGSPSNSVSPVTGSPGGGL